MHVVIVGAGIGGLSTAWALQRQGHRVSLLDRGPIPNPQASSFDQHRLIRRAYGRQTGYMHMITDAWAAWHRLWADLGQELAVRCGAVALSSVADDFIGWSYAAMRDAGYRVEALDRRDLAARFPMLDPRGVELAFFDADGGVLLASRIVKALARLVVERGATALPYAQAVAIDVDRARVELADGSALQGDVVVVAAGAFTPGLLPQFAAELRPSRQVVAYVELTDGLRKLWCDGPAVIGNDAGSGFYLVPPVTAADGRETGLKIGDHVFSLRGDPAEPGQRTASAEEGAAVLGQIRGRLAAADSYRLERAAVCFYTVEAGERFRTVQIGKAAWAMSNCSGHGFKFGACIGEAMADALVGRRSAQSLTDWVAGNAG